MSGDVVTPEVLEPVEQWDDDEVPSLESGSITPTQWMAFRAFYGLGANYRLRTDCAQAAAQAANVSIRSIYNWRRAAWWKELEEAHWEQSQKRFRAVLAQNADKLATGIVDVGKDPTSKVANAQVAAGRLFAEMGDKPLIDRRGHSEININQNTLVNKGSITVQRLESVGQEKMLELLTSDRPVKELLEE